jgi:hypothetical protein
MYASLTIDANTNCVTNADFYFYPAEYAIKPPIVPHPHFSPARLLPPSHTSTHVHSVRPACVPPPAPAWSGRIGCRALRPLEPRRRLRRQHLRHKRVPLCLSVLYECLLTLAPVVPSTHTHTAPGRPYTPNVL